MDKVTKFATIQAVGLNKWTDAMAEYLQDGWELEHFSTTYSPAQGIIHTGVFIVR